VETQPEPVTAEESVDDWRDRALRLQAEMENYRKRQRRLAEDRMVEERERLLRRFLQVADELERALSASHADATSLRQGVELTHRTLMQHLEQEGVEPIPAEGQPFDPKWHEAVGATPQHEPGVQPETVVEVLRPGYRLDGHLLRPARVLISA
jgi:molecular chaperone GrpE